MHKVYRGINVTLEEVYHGVAEDLDSRKEDHCSGLTKALKEWKCGEHKIIWREVDIYETQSEASKVAHELERSYKHRKGFKNINTRGI